MKKNVFLTIMLMVFLQMVSCKKIVEGINDNPNVPTDADATIMLPSVETADMLLQGGDVARTAGTWCGYFTGVFMQSAQIQTYNVTASNFDQDWFLVYDAVIKNARLMRQKALVVNNMRLVGIGQLLEAHAVGTATDLWGDIPFTQAYNINYSNPAYDAQASVYAGVQALLDSAIANMASTAYTDFSAQEVFYAGNITKFIQAAYTVKARNYLHTRQYDLALAAATKGLSAQANDWLAPYPAATKGNSNPYYQYQATDRIGSMDGSSSYAVSLLKSTGANYRGNSKTIETARYNYLYNGTLPTLNITATGFFFSSTSFPMATYAENLLILAECDERLNGFNAGLARLNTYRGYLATGGYINAAYLIAGNYKYDAYVSTDFNSGGIGNPTVLGLAQDRALLRNILQERYVTFIGQIEGFNDIRRTQKETDVRVTVPINTGTQIPQRFLYPQDEVDGNTSTPKPIPALFAATPVNL